MGLGERAVRIRVDGDAVHVLGERFGHERMERWTVGEGEDPLGVLERVLGSSRLLRPGRACEVGLEIESTRTLYRVVEGESGGAGEGTGVPHGVRPVLPRVIREALEPILARRRVHGPAWFSAGPALRAIERLQAPALSGGAGRGLLIDRSSTAVTVLVVEGTAISWGRGAPALEAPAVAAHLLRRAAAAVRGGGGVQWWHLIDVCRPVDEQRRRREAREFADRCEELLGDVPRLMADAR